MIQTIPEIAECRELMSRYCMLDNIRLHSFMVARVAETLINSLNLPPENESSRADRHLVRAGALLHDIAKTRCLDGSCLHAEEGRLLCEQLGYHEVGRIVGEHVILSSFTPDDYRQGLFAAREIVYYADKRVRHDTIVPLEARLDYILSRYGNGSEPVERRIRSNFAICRQLEQYLFTYLDFSPDELADRVEAHPFDPAAE